MTKTSPKMEFLLCDYKKSVKNLFYNKGDFYEPLFLDLLDKTINVLEALSLPDDSPEIVEQRNNDCHNLKTACNWGKSMIVKGGVPVKGSEFLLIRSFWGEQAIPEFFESFHDSSRTIFPLLNLSEQFLPLAVPTELFVEASVSLRSQALEDPYWAALLKDMHAKKMEERRAVTRTEKETPKRGFLSRLFNKEPHP